MTRALAALTLLSASAAADPLVVATGDPGGHVTTQVAVGCLSPGARCEKTAGARRTAGIFGLRGSESVVDGSDAKAGLALSSLSRSVVTDPRGGVTARAGHMAFIGGGRGGVEGGLGVDLGFGLFHAMGNRHGPFSRLGGRAFVLGSSVFYASLVELPQFELGYQLLSRDLYLELAPRVGSVLTGRMNPGDDRRRLGPTFEWGGRLALGAGPLDLDVELTRVTPRDADYGSVDLVSALLCGGARRLGACFEARWFHGATDGRAQRVDTVLLAVTLGSAEKPMGH
ncbi:MAG: hypothetical protein L6Q84_18125 [Polyangiaceae bacterium]|nr:hypothetical protein [Polyangiaceae bacterium]